MRDVPIEGIRVTRLTGSGLPVSRAANQASGWRSPIPIDSGKNGGGTMRKLTFLVVFLAALYGGYWFVGARALEAGLRDGLADLQAAGWEARYTDLNTVGFPSRFDTTITDLSLITPDSRFSYRGPFLQAFALSYQPNRAIVVFPEAFRLSVEGRPVNVDNTGLRLSAGIKARPDAALDAVTAEAEMAEISAEALGLLRLADLLAAIRAKPDTDSAYDLYLRTDRIDLPQDVQRRIDPAGRLGGSLTDVVFDSAVRLDRPINRFAFDGSAPEPVLEQFTLNGLNIAWGEVSLRASGMLDVDSLGIPEGRITFETAQWREIIELLVNAGLIEPGIAPTLTNVARSMARGGEVLELPIAFQNGFMSVGPMPLGPAPRLR